MTEAEDARDDLLRYLDEVRWKLFMAVDVAKVAYGPEDLVLLSLVEDLERQSITVLDLCKR